MNHFLITSAFYRFLQLYYFSKLLKENFIKVTSSSVTVTITSKFHASPLSRVVYHLSSSGVVWFKYLLVDGFLWISCELNTVGMIQEYAGKTVIVLKFVEYVKTSRQKELISCSLHLEFPWNFKLNLTRVKMMLVVQYKSMFGRPWVLV